MKDGRLSYIFFRHAIRTLYYHAGTHSWNWSWDKSSIINVLSRSRWY